MSAYVPEFVYGFTGWDANNQPMHGLVEWPEHLKPRQDGNPSEEPAIGLTKKGEAYVERALAEADGVFFLTIDSKDRQSIATSIEKLINMLDELDPDCDLEPDEGAEPSLGWPEGGRGCVPFSRTARLDDDIEQDDSDCEPSLGAPERHANRSQIGWAAGGSDDREEEETDQNGDEGDYSVGTEDGGFGISGDSSGVVIAKELLKKAGKRKDPDRAKIVGERVRIMPDGNVFRTFVPADSGYVLTTKRQRKGGLSGDDFDRLPWA